MRLENGRFLSTENVIRTLYNTDQGERGDQWMRQFFPKRPFAESSDGLHIIRRGQGSPSQVTVTLFPGFFKIAGVNAHTIATRLVLAE